MPVTAFVPQLGYDRAAATARRAHPKGSTLRVAVIADSVLSGDQFDALVRPSDWPDASPRKVIAGDHRLLVRAKGMLVFLQPIASPARVQRGRHGLAT